MAKPSKTAGPKGPSVSSPNPPVAPSHPPSPDRIPVRGAASHPNPHPLPRASPQAAAPRRAEPTREQIARRAYEIWQKRGCPPETEDENWIRAVRELQLGRQ